METDDGPPVVLESSGGPSKSNQGGLKLGEADSPEVKLDVPTLEGGPVVPNLMDIHIQVILRVHNQWQAKRTSSSEGEEDLHPPAKYRCYSKCPVSSAEKPEEACCRESSGSEWRA